ncbi:mannose-1-phosphate guanylyltransferase/mannose-6-phosphate isomerase [Dissulfurirhabdus thermomarina]|uniref:mannose-1-phosphate guanylyltransferase/mannose-6-phosphate isomerase n=1 Tax=Dissulfurirhabdus thermomarina TaxID=1765737 RepID=UPI00142E91ED|nr:mannose-1-phosphate guanylyltransferase/mannose-6-phosphate isomerase [Dissulfurirhabdus thermomarina]NMX23532.1 mannose-1-phosphate guanylyltransferase/mannose-6-phosphate isomerase [Dissulfurirhabdus thermomarina]
MKLVPVILSGGSGTRLWPLSRAAHPKQFLRLGAGPSLLRDTVERMAALPGRGAPVLVCHHRHRFLAAEELRGAGVEDATLILEPAGRNTAPAAACAALEVLRAEGDDALLLVSPADHLLEDRAAFAGAVAAGRPAAEAGALVTFGVTPAGPETGYGYIRPGGEGPGPVPVAEFVEKPDREAAEAYVAAGCLWNSGIFLFRARRYLEELERFAPEILAACREAHARARVDLDFLRLDPEAFGACPSDSIDYAVMERTGDAVVVPLPARWSDLGSWSALWAAGGADRRGNVFEGDVVAEDVRGCLLRAEHRLVAAVGLEDHVVVETADAVLVAPRDRVQEVKALVARLRAEGRGEAETHRRVFRPWGSYEQVDAGDRFQVKRITVKPGARLSLQRHHHRAEHWVVVRGTARITRGDEVLVLTEDQSTYIPLGTVHRLENPGKIPLEIIEVQTGSYLGEDDIVRLEDAYGREGEGEPA